jgi:hypothetical protein
MSDHDQQSEGQSLIIAPPKGEALQTAINKALDLTSRRRFLAAGILGTAGLALSPFERVLALQNENCPNFDALYKPGKRGFWATFLNMLEFAAGIFGFGALFTTVKNLVDNVRGNYKQIARDALAATLQELPTLPGGYPIHINNKPQGAYNPIGITPINRNVLNDPRVILPALRLDKFNGLTTFLNFDAGTARKAIAGQLAAPSLGGLLSCAVRDSIARYGYRAEDYINKIVFPGSQEKKSYGNYNSPNDMCDQYTTAEGAVIEVCYKNVRDNAAGGRVEGEVTHFKLEARDSSNKRMGIKRVSFNTLSPAPEVEFGFGTNYIKGNRPPVT